MEKQTTFEQIVQILLVIQNELKELNSKLDSQKEKVIQKEKENMSILGGIIGGDKIGGIRGKEKEGKKGGGCLSDFNDEEHSELELLNKLIFQNLKDEVQIAYLSTRDQKIHALKAIRKLHKLGYGMQQIQQALFNAFQDAFWNDKIRHLKALANTMKNGELVIMNLLKKNAQQTKINAPVHAQYRG